MLFYEQNHKLQKPLPFSLMKKVKLQEKFAIFHSNKCNMQINIDILTAWGGISKIYKKNEIIFNEGDTARCYYQIIEGSVKMYNTNSEGKEFLQGIFKDGDSFGEPMLFIDEHYPSTSVALKDSTIIKVSKQNFNNILEEYPQVQKGFIVLLSRRIFNKATTLKEIVNNTPESKILAFLDAKKDKKIEAKQIVPYTRQEIANFTGLRVETVIRALVKLSHKNKVEIVNRKLYY